VHVTPLGPPLQPGEVAVNGKAGRAAGVPAAALSLLSSVKRIDCVPLGTKRGERRALWDVPFGIEIVKLARATLPAEVGVAVAVGRAAGAGPGEEPPPPPPPHAASVATIPRAPNRRRNM
jgi:hypothetical protein